MSTQPKTVNHPLQQVQSLSEPDLKSTPDTATVTNQHNITLRHKRPRRESHPNSEDSQNTDDSSDTVSNQFSHTFNEFRNEIMQMLTSWKTDNDDRLSSWKAEHDAVLKGLVRDMSELKTQYAEMRKCHMGMEQSMQSTDKCYKEMKKELVDLDIIII